ncbi:MAG: UDP-2,3-diacylglucosamine diphosphatase LpxI [Boseongicola sp.]
MLAVIAGRGKLPAALVEGMKQLPFIASLEGFAPDFLVPDRTFRLEHLGTLISELKALGVTEVCFVGAISRPKIDPSQFDSETLPLVPRMIAALQAGDDGALRIVLEIFEEAGLTIRAADEFAPTLLPRSGVITARRIDDEHRADAKRAEEIVAGLGSLDIGQSCVVHRGQALAIEGSFGTDWMLQSLVNRPGGQGGLFYTASKPGQDRRIDLPVIGVDTVAGVAKAGLAGIVIETNGVMVLDLSVVERAADEAGLFLWVRDQ